MNLILALVIIFVGRVPLAGAETAAEQEFDLAIIGAGAAGVAHAYYLKKENPSLKIAIFEKESHIGGKCYSYIDDQGRAHDMGAIAEVVNYQTIRELINISGVKRMDHAPVIDSIQPYGSELKKFGLIYSLTALWNYITLCEKHKVKEHWNLTDFVDDPMRMIPLSDLIKTYHLEPLSSIFNRAFKSYGYGDLDQILSGIAFSYIDTQVLFSGVVSQYPLLKALFGKLYPVPEVFLQEGFQKVFQNLVAKMQKEVKPLKVLLDTKVTSIDSTTKGVILHTKEKQWRAKVAYVTCGWQHIAMPSINEKVRNLFRNLIHEDYGTTVFKTISPASYEYILNYQSSGAQPLLYGTKWSRQYSSNIGTAYTNGTAEQAVEIFSALKDYLSKRGITVDGKVPLAQRQVEYYPRFTFEEVKSGAYKIMEENQGGG